MNNLFRNSRRKLSQGLLFWRELGEGTPIIFLHGAWNDSCEWLSVMESLSHYHCFAPDLFGFGESDDPKVHYSIDLLLESLAEFIHALKLEKVYLVGHSLGGWIAASYALKYSEQVYGLVLLAPEGVEIKGQENRLQKMRQLVKRSPFIFKLLRLLRPITKMLGWNQEIEQDWQLYQTLVKYPTACKILFQRQQPEINAELLNDRLYNLEIPVLILQGGEDTPHSLAMSQVYSQAALSELKIIAHGKSDLPESCAGIVAGYIREFIKNQDLSY
jgi:pimeloyl-ACP methyl ester carboxylesterase